MQYIVRKKQISVAIRKNLTVWTSPKADTKFTSLTCLPMILLTCPSQLIIFLVILASRPEGKKPVVFHGKVFWNDVQFLKKTRKQKHNSIFLFNKKVLLRERKRHTAHRVASARYAALSNGDGGYSRYPPTPSRPGWGTPPRNPDLAGVPSTIQTWLGHPPSPSRPDWGTPPPTIQTWLEYPPSRPGIGYPQTCDGLPPRPDLWWGTPPLSRCGLTHKVKILPYPPFGIEQ